MCTLYLADLGADVIKVEDTGAGDYARSLATSPASKPTGMGAPGHSQARNGPEACSAKGSSMTAWYRAINRNKRSLAIDLKSADGHAAFVELARGADVIVEGFRPGVV